MNDNTMIEFAAKHGARDAVAMCSFLKNCHSDRWEALIEKLKANRPELFGEKK